MKISVIIFLLLILIWGCSDDPNSVGSGLIPENDKLKVIIIDSETDSFEQVFESFQKDSLFFGNSKRLLLGEYKNIKSEALIKFLILLPDSVKSLLETTDSLKLVSSWVEIYPDYWLGDKSNINFTAQEILTDWNPIDFNQDTLDLIKNSLGPDIMERIVYSEGDTVLRFEISNNVVENWIYESFDDSYPANNGIILSPISQTGIVGFQGITPFPNNPFPILHMEFEKIGGGLDTVFSQPNLDIHVPSGERLMDPVNEIILQGAIGVRGKLRFSLENVPDRILVNSAILQLFVNNANSFEADVSTDSIAVSMLSNFNSDSISIEFGRYPMVRKDDSYEGEIRQFVQRWIDGEPNEGMELKLTDESRGASAISFYSSSHPNTSLRPRLTLSFTRK